MPNRTRRTDEDRAEARRRARLAARGLDPEDEHAEDEDEEAPAATRSPAGGSFLTRLFPPAPRLPGKPDPLAGFHYSGPWAAGVSGLYLLAHNPIPWLGMGALWGVARLLTVPSMLGLVASLISFAAVILAGWLGWSRPWLFGLMAAVVGMIIYALIWSLLLGGRAEADYASGPQIFFNTIYYETVTFQPLFGVIAGWYGGYLRRRMAATSAASTPDRRSRRR